MDILMLMNRGHVSYYLAEWLRTLGYVVIEVNNIEQAEEILNQQRIDCIITCTYMSSFCYSGLLDASERQQTQRGYLAGLVWLHNYVFVKDAGWKERVIIYEDADNLRTAKDLIEENSMPISLEGLFVVEAVDRLEDPDCLRKCDILPRLEIISRMVKKGVARI